MLVIAADATKSAQKHIYYQGETAAEIARQCLEKHGIAGIIAYTVRAVPVADRLTEPTALSNIIERLEASRGLPEPARAVREAVLLIQEIIGPVRAESLIVLFWSMPKRPRIPLNIVVPLAKSANARLVIVGLQFSQPRWMRRYEVENLPSIVYKRNLKPRDLARKIEC